MQNIGFFNNIFIVQGGERFVDIGTTLPFVFKNNLYYATDGIYTGGWKWGGVTYTSLAAWRASSGTPETVGGSPVGLQVNPQIASVVSGAQPTSVAAMETMPAFMLIAGSPAINAGADLRTATYGSLSVGTRDFYNNTLPQDVAFDIGPHEVVASPSVNIQVSSGTMTVPEGSVATFTVVLTAQPAASTTVTVARTSVAPR